MSFLLTILAMVPVAQAEPSLQAVHCKSEVEETLTQWGSRNEWVRQVPTKDGAISFRTPTKDIGIWIQSAHFPEGRVELSRLGPQNLITRTWSPKTCTQKTKITRLHFQNSNGTNSFSDESLKSILREYRTGVIFLWSPHMPYSVMGYSTLQEAAGKLGLKTFRVLDPRANLNMAEKMISEGRMPADSNSRMHSFELYQRGVLNHYPSIVLFKNGQMLSYAIPGFKGVEFYETYLRKKFKK